MTIAEAISLGITIGLGIVSIALGVFAIWLSHRFARESTTSLSVLRDVAGEIRALTETGLSHQSKFSTKMLDSILERSPYGESLKPGPEDSAKFIKEAIHRPLKELETRITHDLEKKMQKILGAAVARPEVISELIKEIRGDINSLIERASDVSSSVILPQKLREKIKEWKTHPAYIFLIALIIRENATSEDDIKEAVPKYNLTKGWDFAIESLLKEGILNGSQNEFNVADEYINPLKLWLARNSELIESLISTQKRHFEDEEGRRNTIEWIANRLTL